MFRLAHLSDPHLGPLPASRLSDLASKRLLGYLNWHMHRSRKLMQAGSVEAVLADIQMASPDHIAITGDLINIGLETEITRAAAWLATIGAPRDVSVVPGNHDAYVARALEKALANWRAYAIGDTVAGPRFPYVRRRGPIALIGVSSAIATGPFMATGKVDAPQCDRLVDILQETGAEGLCRIILMHHPAIDGATKWQSRLLDADRFRKAVATAGAELILHGHTHKASINWINGLARPVPLVGVQAASLQPSPMRRGPGWNLIEIEGNARDWRITLVERGIPSDGARMMQMSRQRLMPA